jgi:4-amino-4-deoxy-L-arabinose transferase-like glycosyltransferase
MGYVAPKHAWWLVFAVIFIWFCNLEYRTLIKPDEGRYAEIPREMVVSGDWTTPRLNDLKYFEKPPLQYWATATAYTVFGEHQWTSRLWAALTGFAGIILVCFAGTRLFGRETSWYASLILGSSLLYVLMAHVNTLDMGVTFFITLGIVGLLLGQTATQITDQRNGMWLAWVGMALAVLSKGLMGIILPGTAVLIYAVIHRDLGVLKRMHWLSGLAIFFAITAPWFYQVMQANPEFFERFFIYEHYTRFTTKDLGRYQPWYYFVPILLAGALPWTLLMFNSMANSWRIQSNYAASGKPFHPARFLLIWAVFIYVFFSISGSKLPSYLLPMFPALALLMGKRLVEIREKTLIWQLLPILPIPVIWIALALNIDRFADSVLQKSLYPHYVPWLVAGAGTLLLGLIIAIVLLLKERKPTAVLVLSLSALLTAQIGLTGYETVAQERSAKHIANAIRSQVTPTIPFYSVLTYEQTLAFYLKHTFTLVQYQDEMAFGIKQEPQRWIPTLAAFHDAWAKQPQALAIMPVWAYPQLQQQGTPMTIIYQDTQHIVVKKP